VREVLGKRGGERLAEVKATHPRGGWQKWLKKEFGWHQTTAVNFIRVADVFGSKLSPGLSLEIDAKALYLLAGPEVSEEIRDKAIERAATGRVTLADARKMVAGEVAAEIEEARRLGAEKPVIRPDGLLIMHRRGRIA
jgi:Protein of unknown function (DUF3102)